MMERQSRRKAWVGLSDRKERGEGRREIRGQTEVAMAGDRRRRRSREEESPGWELDAGLMG